MSNPHPMLSTQGQHRRDEILALALDEARRLQGRRKRRRRIAAGAAALLIMTATVWALWSPAEPGAERPHASVPDVANPRPTAPVAFDLDDYIVRSEVEDLDRYLVRTREELPPGIILSDTELLRALADLGRVDGIIRTGGKVWLVSELDSRPPVHN